MHGTMQLSASDGQVFGRVHRGLSPSKRRLREIVDENRSQECTWRLHEQHEAQRVMQTTKYHMRWPHLRVLFMHAKISGHTEKQVNDICGRLTKYGHQLHKNNFVPHRGSMLSIACFEACMEPQIPVELIESILCRVLCLDARHATVQQLTHNFLSCLYITHPRHHHVIDYRLVCAMWDVLEKPHLTAMQRLVRWFNIYSVDVQDEDRVVHFKDLKALCTITSSSTIEEEHASAFAREVITTARLQSSQCITLSDLLRFARTEQGYSLSSISQRRWCFQMAYLYLSIECTE
jgi:hypothetical protein